jgi:integrase
LINFYVVELQMNDKKWRRRWKRWVSVEPVRPGIYELRSGGFLIRARITDCRTGRRTTILRAAHGSLREAEQLRAQAAVEARTQVAVKAPPRRLFSEFAASHYERKVIRGDLRSAKSRERWDVTLRLHVIPALGMYYCHDLRFADIETWKDTLAQRINTGALGPRTANGWLSILRVVTKAMTAELELPRDPSAGVQNFDVSTSHTYTDEAPNALTAEQTQKFLATMRQLHPNHYAMTLLGFATGLRPSSLRPLRRCDPESDVLWADGILLVRRSHVAGQEIMATTKTKRHQRIHLPPEVMDVLREHVASLPDGARTECGLLFPSVLGALRTHSALDKPFAQIAQAIGLPFHFTPRGMRRTFQDLCRAAEVKDVVTRSISGHATETMQRHYSTVQAEEQRQSIGQVISLVGFRSARLTGEPAAL